MAQLPGRPGTEAELTFLGVWKGKKGNHMSDKQEATALKNAGKPSAPKLVWDDKDLKTTFSNVVNAAATREEVSVFFGTNQTWNAGDPEYRVKLTDRIVMTPFAAKRLSMLLGRVLDDYERKHGALDMAGREQTPAN